MSVDPKQNYMAGPSQDAIDEFMNTTEEVHSVWYGVCESIGIEIVSILDTPDRRVCLEEIHYVALGLVAGCLAGAVIAGAAVTLSLALIFSLRDAVIAGMAGAAWVAIVLLRGVAPGVWDQIRAELSA